MNSKDQQKIKNSIENRHSDNFLNSIKNIIIEIHLPGQFPYIERIFKNLAADALTDPVFALLDDEYANIKRHLISNGISEDDMIPCSLVPSLDRVDLFLSPTNWTTFLPKQDIPKIQLFHSLIYKNTIFAGQFDDFNIIFSPGEYHNDYYKNTYLKNKPGLKDKQTLYNIGYPKLDEVINGEIDKDDIVANLGLDSRRPTVLYAPTWELTASLHTKGLKIIDALANMDINVLVKLHPMSYRDPKFAFANGGLDWSAIMASTESKYTNVKNILDPNANPYILASDLMVTDASGVGLEFMTTNKPLVFVDIPKFFENCGHGGVEDKCRVAGEIVKDINDLSAVVKDNLDNPGKFEKQRKEFSGKLLFNPGEAAGKATVKILELLNGSVGPKASSNSSVGIEDARKAASVVDGFLSDEEGELLYTLAKKCTGKGAIVEIGSWKGRSAVFLGKGSKAGNNVTVYAVDPHTGTPAHKRQGVKGTFEIFQDNIRNAQVDDVITPIVKPAQIAAENFDEPVEVLFIDGDHEYASAKLDYEVWLPKMVEGGIILLHDSAGPKAWPGVKKFAGELVAGSSDIKNVKIADSITYFEVAKGSRQPVMAQPETPEVEKGLTSIIAIALNGLDYTKRCIESIREHTGLPYELIVVDNGSTDGTLEYLQEQGDVKLVANSENVGAPFARNQGLQIAKGEYIVFFDNDIVATKDWLKILVEHSKNNPEVGLIGPMSNYVSGPQFVPDSSFEDINDMHSFARKLTADHNGSFIPANRLILFAMFATRAVIDKIGGMDPLYGKWGFEDDDYCIRAMIAGFKLAIAKDVFIYHKGSSTAEAANIDYSQLLEENWEKFKDKWGLPRYHSYMQGYPVQAIASQPFDHNKHYCSLFDRTINTRAHAGSGELTELFSQTHIDKLPPEQKRQFILTKIANECSGKVAEIGSRDIELAAGLAVRGLDVTRFSPVPQNESKTADGLFINNIAFKEASFEAFRSTGKEFDTFIIFAEENQSPETVAEILKEAGKAINSSGKIVVVCESGYKTRYVLKQVLDQVRGIKYDESVPVQYIFGSIKQDIGGEGADLIVVPPEKPASSGLVSIALVIDGDSHAKDISNISNCLNNIFSQTYPDIEVIVCNATLKDNVKEAIRPFQGRIKYIESNKSASGLMKLAVDNSEGEFISFITPSDLLMPGSIEIRVKALSGQQQLGAISTDTIRYLGSMDGLTVRWYAKSLFGGQAVQEQLMANRVHTGSVLFNRSQLLKHDLISGDLEDDLYYGLWLKFFTEGLKLKAINVPAILHKMTSYEELAFHEDINLILDRFETDSGSRQGIVERFINDYPISVLSPMKVMAAQKQQLEGALFAFRASVLIQYAMYGEASKDLAASIKRNPVDVALRADIKELTFFLLMKTIGLNDSSLVQIVARQLIRIDPDNPTAKLHLIRLNLMRDLESGEIDVNKCNKSADELFKLHSDNKFDPFQFLCYVLLASLLGSETIANKMFDKTLSMGMPLPVINKAKLLIQQRMLDENIPDQSVPTGVLRRIEDLVRDTTLSLVMIVKDEEDNLARCLKSVEGVVDEIVVVDTGSKDKTKKIATIFGAKIVDQKWNNDFSEARNVSIEHATGDWLMFLDADEELVEEDKELLLSLKDDPVNEGFNFVISSFIGSSAGQETLSNIAIRMWKNRPQHRFDGTLHEQILNNVLNTGPVKTVSVRVNHYGYLQQIVIDKQKSKRNLEIAVKMVEDKPKDTFAHFSLGLEYCRIAEYENAYRHFEEADKLLNNQTAYFAHVLSLNRVKMLRCLQRYNEALSLVEQEIIKFPGFPDLVYSKALIQFDLNNFAETLNILRVLTEMEPDVSKYICQSGLNTYKAFSLYGATYEMMGDQKMAVSWYSKAFKICPEFMHNTTKLVDILLSTDPAEEVVKYLDKYINFDDPVVLSDISTIFINLGHPETALNYLNKAKDIDENTPNLFVWLGKAHLYLQKRDEALRYLSLVKDSSNAYLESKLDIAYCYGLNGDTGSLEKSLKDLSSIEQMKPYITILSLLFDVQGFANGSKFDEETSSVYWQVLYQLMYMKEFDHFEKALNLKQRLSIEDGVFALNLGSLYNDGKFHDLAIGQFMQALNSGYYDSRSLIILGDECLAHGHYEDAANLYLSAAKMEPPSLGAYMKLVQLLIKQSKYTEAEETLLECNTVFPENDLVKQTLATLQNIFLKT